MHAVGTDANSKVCALWLTSLKTSITSVPFNGPA